MNWQRSTFCGTDRLSEDCVEIAEARNGDIFIRNSKFPEGFPLVVSKEELRAFLAGAKEGEFDHFVS